jgi:hypothetical protein
MKKLTAIFSALVFISIIVLLDSMVFSVRRITARCYNDDDSGLEARVAAGSGIDLGQSIFFMSAAEAEAHIDSAFPEIKVLNVERTFPDSVRVNFIKLKEILAFADGNGGFITADNNLIAARTNVPASELNFTATIAEFDAASVRNTPVKVTVTGVPVAPEPKRPLTLPSAVQAGILAEFVSALNRLDYREYDFSRLFVTADLTDTESETGALTLQTRSEDRGGGGVTIRIVAAARRLPEKLRYAVSVYEQHVRGTLPVSGGKLPSDKIKIVENNNQIIYAVI